MAIHDREQVDLETTRLRVAGGWLYERSAVSGGGAEYVADLTPGGASAEKIRSVIGQAEQLLIDQPVGPLTVTRSQMQNLIRILQESIGEEE